jgi:hypothetical protein
MANAMLGDGGIGKTPGPLAGNEPVSSQFPVSALSFCEVDVAIEVTEPQPLNASARNKHPHTNGAAKLFATTAFTWNLLFLRRYAGIVPS